MVAKHKNLNCLCEPRGGAHSGGATPLETVDKTALPHIRISQRESAAMPNDNRGPHNYNDHIKANQPCAR